MKTTFAAGSWRNLPAVDIDQRSPLLPHPPHRDCGSRIAFEKRLIVNLSMVPDQLMPSWYQLSSHAHVTP